MIKALKLDFGVKEKIADIYHVGSVIMEVNTVIKHIKRWAAPEHVDLNLYVGPGWAKIKPEPLGVALVMSSWNYPYMTGLPYVAACIAAGNCVAYKPSERSPYSSNI